jgi:hypothetical protein
MSKYKVGDKVRIVPLEKLVKFDWVNDAGEMNKWAGKTMTIRSLDEPYYQMEEDKHEDGGWFWWSEAFEERSENVIPYETNYLYKHRRGSVTVLLDDKNDKGFYTADDLRKGKAGVSSLRNHNHEGRNTLEKACDIIAYSKQHTQSDAITILLSNSNIEWDWEETKETVMTVAEIEKKLGIKNLRIKKED